ncbi:MAG: YbhB/YbcL family Raf kinase inhibitor-like protein [Pantoea sp.]|nr:YbhB/YbcL family Raf kinase inhibitor-like protein [Pantoea sp.]
MRVFSNDFKDGDKMPERQVFNGMGYQGDNISPHLAWDEVPEGTKSFVVTCYELQTRTDFGKAGYGGAAPPQGESHRYIFTVHALDVEKIEVDAEASGAMVGFNVHFHALASASITVKYS